MSSDPAPPSRLCNVRLTPSKDGRDHVGLGNTISTTKFNILTWLPISLAVQFRRVANVYFLMMSFMMMIGTYAPQLFESPLDPWSTVLTLLFVMGVTSIREGLEDLERAKFDKEENERDAIVCTFAGDKFIETVVRTKDIRMGDIIKLDGHCQVPCDMALLLTSNYKDGNTCYIETANIDGETNLKVREAPDGVKTLITTGKPTKPLFEGRLEVEPPNKNIHNFAGAYHCTALGKEGAIPLSADNILLRAAIFSNTDWGYGVAIYCGQESKIQMNNALAPTKMSRLEKYANVAVEFILVAMVLCVTLCVLGIYICGYQDFDKFPYVYVTLEDGSQWKGQSKLPLWLEQWFTFFILFNNFVPISLYVTLEMVNVCQSYFVKNDIRMWDEPTNSPCIVKSSNMCQELGMVSNIFSDKTGTLTRNEMKFVKFIVDGKLHEVDVTMQDKEAQALMASKGWLKSKEFEFMRCLVTCHSVVREKTGKYRAESPDELALVEGCAAYNCELIERGTASMIINLAGVRTEYMILATNAFNSDRKRSSCLLHDPAKDEYILFCKGADSIMMSVCAIPPAEKEQINKSLYDLACLGLRTLCIAKKDLTKAQALAWLKQFKEASLSLTNRAELLDKAASDIEMGMGLLGITAIEDRLQDEVPECIADFIKAGIVVWMLTGDKEETAVQIANSCNLVDSKTELKYLTKINSEQEFYVALRKIYEELQEKKSVGTDVALVMDGPSFLHFNSENIMQRAFLIYIGQRCRSVVACRLTPIQKQMVVGLVKVDAVPETICLAIGDGANDVSMIREANVGVGIIGKEGRQAANNADFAIGQFKFLRHLMLVHGRANYLRQSKVFLYSVHKNFVLTLTLIYFSYYAAFSGTSPYESTVYTGFNLILGLPIICVGAFDHDMDDEFLLKYPQMYVTGRSNSQLSTGVFKKWGVNALLYAAFTCAFCYSGLYDSFNTYDLFLMGTFVFLMVTLLMTAKVMFMHNTYNWYHVISIFIFSIISSFLYILVLSSGIANMEYYNVGTTLFEQNLFWMCAIAGLPVGCFLIDLTGQAFYVFVRPTNLQNHRDVYFEQRGIGDSCDRKPVKPQSWNMRSSTKMGLVSGQTSSSSMDMEIGKSSKRI
jgi:phospholipid-transporting ATPase